MEAIWYTILAVMLGVYVALDGFDFGAGILHLLVAKSDDERRTVFAAIGPVWDGNEVWLIASGGVLFFAFPKAYASGFSGFYLPLMMVVWLLLLRGLGIELRSQVQNPLWRAFWDAAFSVASGLLALLFGVAFANLLRGVPVESDGYFVAPLFTDFSPRGAHVGALDWYTIPVGLFAVVALAGHGARYLAWKTDGEVGARSARLARPLGWATIAGFVVVSALTAIVSPALARSFVERVYLWPLLVVALAAPLVALRLEQRGRHLGAFLASSGFLASAVVAAAGELYPNILGSTLDGRFDLTAHGTHSGSDGLRTGLVWWVPAMGLVIGYTVFVFRSFRGKARGSDHA